MLLETNEIDDDEDVVVDQGAAFNVDVSTSCTLIDLCLVLCSQILGDNLGELSVGTTAVLPVHRVPNAHALKRIAKKAILPAIHITRACEINEEETHSSDPSKPGQRIGTDDALDLEHLRKRFRSAAASGIPLDAAASDKCAIGQHSLWQHAERFHEHRQFVVSSKRPLEHGE